ncbi:MAG: uroporphyrinogen decarboxylase family protein [Salinivirgaceae bacterium]|nr:uroporphyrinogen decarboxylase family protein [Salinivirgaceae bacterium]
MITGFDRLMAAANGEKSDRIPVFCNLLDQGAKELGLSLEEYYSKGEYVAEGQLKMREKYGYDNLWSLFYVGKEAELLGCKNIIYANDGPPTIGHMVIRKPEDIHNMVIPDDISNHPEFQETLKCLQILKKESGGKYPICAYITASMAMPAMLMGMEKWMDMLLSGPFDLRDKLLAMTSDFFKKQLAAYRKAGADIIIYSNPFGSPYFVSAKLFNELSMPWMEKDLQGVDRFGLVYYCGGARMNQVLNQVIEKLGFATFYLSPFDDIAQGKQLIAGRALCAGVINDIKLIDWSYDEIKAEVKRMLDAGMKGGKFFFGTLVMPLYIPEKNIRYMLEAVYEYGSYA